MGKFFESNPQIRYDATKWAVNLVISLTGTLIFFGCFYEYSVWVNAFYHPRVLQLILLCPSGPFSRQYGGCYEYDKSRADERGYSRLHDLAGSVAIDACKAFCLGGTDSEQYYGLYYNTTEVCIQKKRGRRKGRGLLVR